jgi:hypothetical protein
MLPTYVRHVEENIQNVQTWQMFELHLQILYLQEPKQKMMFLLKNRLLMQEIEQIQKEEGTLGLICLLHIT